MKRITIEIPDGYDDVVSITAVGSEAKSETCRTTNLMTRIEDIMEHDGDVLVLVEKGDTEWKKPETDWIPVVERLPEQGQVVLAFGKRHATSGQFSGTGSDPSVWYWKGSVKTVTHWMPLPEPPEV